MVVTYCGSRGNFTTVWTENGFSPCFFDTVAATLLLITSLLPLSVQIHITMRNAVQIERKHYPILLACILRWVILAGLFVETPMRFALDFAKVYQEITGAQIFYFAARLLTISMLIVLLCLERTKLLLQMISSNRHSFVLIGSCFLLLSIEIICVLSWKSNLWWFQQNTSGDKIEFALWIMRLVCGILLFVITLLAPDIPHIDKWTTINTDFEQGIQDETDCLLNSRHKGEFSQRSGSTWKDIKRKVKLLWPYMWPSGKLSLQFNVFICIGCVVAGRVVNLYVPIFYKQTVDGLTVKASWKYVLGQIGIYIALKLLQGGGAFDDGLLNGLRIFLWVRVRQYANRRLQVKLISHLHSLSLRWHLSRKTGEVLRSFDRGATSINTLLAYILFTILPTLVDVMVAIMYFSTAFNGWFGLIIGVCIAAYIVNTILVTEWRTKYRRDQNTKDNKAGQRAIDSLLNSETVKYYNAEHYEVKRYDDAMLDFQSSEFLDMGATVILHISQNAILDLGLLVGSIVCAKFVLDGTFHVGDFVLFVTYVTQLYTPLNFFGKCYSTIQSDFIGIEYTLEIFDHESEVRDKVDAVALEVQDKTIEFENVCFSYLPEKIVLKNLSFRVNPGQTVALVGPTGSGKSTILRLLFRLYDTQSGEIRIGGINISTVTQSSLRQHIGVVPQDSVLFNDSIQNNIRYGRLTATDAEVEQAAMAADFHDRITTFPNGYQTVVGERGLNLSCGEKQRVAIARTILKDSDIVLLDEAMSALDAEAEHNIHASLSKIRMGKTTIIVAHRLSSIVNADCILVLHNGETKEQGSHEELLKLDGIYSRMWSQQFVGDNDRRKKEKCCEE